MLEGKKILPTKVLVKKVEKQQKVTPSGLVIPDVVEEVTCKGEVVLVGTGLPNLPMTVKIGDHVMYPPRAPQKVLIDDIPYFLLNLQDILLIW